MLNIILTIILLLVVGVIAWRGYPLIWATFIILSIVLYYSVFNSLIQLQTPWLIGAGVLWLAGLALVIKRGRNKTGNTFMLLVVMTIALVAMSFFAPKAIQSSSSEQTTVPTSAESVSKDDPNAEWFQWSADRSDNRLISTGIDADTPEKALENKLALAKHDAVSLTAYAYQAKLIPADQTNINAYLTEDAKYLNEAGKALWYQLKGNYAGTTNTFAAAPNGTVNSGTNGSGFYTAETGGITGDTKTLVTTYPNGAKSETLTRCGNPVFTGATPGVPTGKTDNPPAPKPPSPPSPPDNPLEPKNPAESTLENPAVDDWKKDDISSGNEDGHTVSNENGAEVSNGYQADPVQDAADAADAAADAAAENEAAHEDAVNEATDTGGGVVDDNQDHTVTTDPAVTNPDW